LKTANILTDIGRFFAPRDLRNSIESKAVYAELKWPIVYHKLFTDDRLVKSERFKDKFTWELFDDISKINETGYYPEMQLDGKNINQQVLYRIIERGENRVGARRGVLFAKDMNLDISIPVMYAMDFSDPHLLDFLKEVLPDIKEDLICPVNYFSRNSNGLDNVKEMKLSEIISKLSGRETLNKYGPKLTLNKNS